MISTTLLGFGVSGTFLNFYYEKLKKNFSGWALFFMGQSLGKLQNKLPAFIYFGLIGFGFTFIEMVFIQRFTNFMGDPIYIVAVALTAILVFSGIAAAFRKNYPGRQWTE